jgi:hypothetical protein
MLSISEQVWKEPQVHFLYQELQATEFTFFQMDRQTKVAADRCLEAV